MTVEAFRVLLEAMRKLPLIITVEMGNIEQVINFKVKLKILRDVL